MKVVFMGTPDFAIPSLKALCEAGYDVSAVFTQTDKPKGRGKVLTPSPVKEYALQAGLPVYQPVSLKKELDTYLPVLESIAPDFIVVVAYGKILPPQVLGVPKFGCINVHGSLLPIQGSGAHSVDGFKRRQSRRRDNNAYGTGT